ncbi:MAG: bifunctional phosphoglucose/phosphomannose isomerase [Candidatus Hodarchaeales archaeon]
MIDLDQPSTYLGLDTLGQFNNINKWSEMLSEGFQAGKAIILPNKINLGKFTLEYNTKPENIIICGMGGSAISGEYLHNYLEKSQFEIPISIHRSFGLPSYVCSKTLILVVSYSGNTRETLNCLYQAIKCSSPIIIISSGGIAKEVADKYNIPFVHISNAFQPRVAFPLLLSTLTGIIQKLFPKLKILESEMDKLIRFIRDKSKSFTPEVSSVQNKAKQYALEWQDKIPIFITSYSALGMRMKGQMNENSKKIAFYDLFPELMHNTVQGWKDLVIEKFRILIVSLTNDSKEMVDKVKFSLIKSHPEKKITIDIIKINGPCFLAELVYGTLLVDYVSLYLACLGGYDPSEMDIISGMKEEFESKDNFDIRKALLTLE